MIFSVSRNRLEARMTWPIPVLAATSSATIRYVQAQPIPIRRLSTIPGQEAGRSTRQKTCHLDAPSV
jgi:hypothetical protein